MNLKKFKKWLAGGRFKTYRHEDTPTAPTDGGRAAEPPESPLAPPRQAQTKAPDTAGETAAPDGAPHHRSTGQRPVSRQGIPILAPDEDLSRCFASPSQAFDTKADASTAPDRKGRNPKRRREFHRQRSDPPRNRLGIRRLKNEDDVWGHFLSVANAGSEEISPPGTPAPPGDSPPRRSSTVDIATDRHGIPRLDDGVDLQRFFEGKVAEGKADGNLGDVFRRTLQHDARGLMKRKSGGVWEPRRLTLKEQLRRYPAPQAQLDLHGATAAVARRRAESYLRTALEDGRLTLRLIVGKGLHSEEGAVLPDVVEDLLLELKREGLVVAFRWEKGAKRKSGAVIVHLAPPF